MKSVCQNGFLNTDGVFLPMHAKRCLTNLVTQLQLVRKQEVQDTGKKQAARVDSDALSDLKQNVSKAGRRILVLGKPATALLMDWAASVGNPVKLY